MARLSFPGVRGRSLLLFSASITAIGAGPACAEPVQTKPLQGGSLGQPSVPTGKDQARSAARTHSRTPDERITVQGRQAAGMTAEYGRKDAALGPLGTCDLLDTPFSIMTVPRDVIVNQQSRNANDLAQYLPSVQLEMRGDPNTSRPQSRGFEADVISNSRLDGLNMVITTPYAAEQFDSLQVLNGLSGALYGPQNPAGTFDYTLNRPTDRPTASASIWPSAWIRPARHSSRSMRPVAQGAINGSAIGSPCSTSPEAPTRQVRICVVV